MILALVDILAKGSDADSSIKLIFGAIVVVIWIIGGIMSQMKKKADRERWNNPQPQQNWDHLLRDLTGGQNKPFTPSAPAPPPIISPQDPRYLPAQAQQPQQTKSFAQQSPRPFVQQYSQAPHVQQYPQRQHIPQYPHRPLPPRRQVAAPLKARPFQGPQKIQRKQKPQRRPPLIPAQAAAVAHQAQVGLIQDATVTMGQAGGSTSLATSSARSSSPRVTPGQLRKLILWSEILSPPLSLRESA